MELIEAIKRNRGSDSPRGAAMLANAQHRKSLLKKAGFQLYESQQSNTARVPDWNDNWAALTWSVLSQNAQKQGHPKAVLIEPADTSLVNIVAESALAWFADRGSAVLVDVDLLVLLHPRWHQVCGDNKSAAKITASAHRLAALMIASAIKEQFHLVVVMTTNSFEDWRPIAELLNQNGYQSHSVLGAQHQSKNVEHGVSLHHELSRLTDMKVAVLEDDHAAVAGADVKVADKPITTSIAPNSPVQRGSREIRLGTFAKSNVPPASTNQTSPNRNPLPLQPSPSNLVRRTLTPTINESPIQPVAPEVSAQPPRQATGPQQEPPPTQGIDVERRKAMQANIRRKADG